MMVWDPIDQYVLLFGGSDGGNQTWSFVGGSWTELRPARSPSSRAYGGIACDPQLSAVVLFGGEHESKVNGATHTTELNDTWTYAGGVWTNITATAGSAPPPRASMGLAYDSADGYLLLFGGEERSNVFLNDSWALEERNWVRLAPSHSPSVRYGLSMVYDPAAGMVLLYGGIGEVKHQQPYHDQTWSYRAGTWRNITRFKSPTGRVWTMLAYYGSGSGGYVVEFGGQANHLKTPTTAQNTTFEFNGFFWENVTSLNSPPTRFGDGMAYDPVDGYLVLFGGLNATTVVAHSPDDTWTWTPDSWTNISATA